MSQERILNELKEEAKELIAKIRRNAESTRHVSLSLTHLEDAVFRLEAARKQAEIAGQVSTGKPSAATTNGHSAPPAPRKVALSVPTNQEPPKQKASPPPPPKQVAPAKVQPKQNLPVKVPTAPPQRTQLVLPPQPQEELQFEPEQEEEPSPAPTQQKPSGKANKTRAGMTAIEPADQEFEASDLSDLP